MRLLGLLLLLTALRGALYIAFIPPWQSPDEPTHFEYVSVLASGANPLRPRPDPELQRRVIRSMDRFDYWRLVFVDRPEPLPETFRSAPFLSVAPSQLHKNPPLYYLLAAGFLRLGRPDSLLAGMYLLRVISLLFTLLTVAVVFAAAREFAPGEHVFQLAAAAFAAFLPQFMVIGTSVSPDPLINLIGSLIVWGALRSLRPAAGPHLPARVVGFLVIGFLASYKFLMVLPALGCWLAAVVWANLSKKRFRLRPVFVSLGLLAALAGAAYLFSHRLAELYSYRLNQLAPAVSDWLTGRSSPPLGYWAWFRWELFKSTWLKFGWLKFELPALVYHALLAVSLAAAAGVVWAAARALFRKAREPFSAGAIFVALAFAVSVLAAYYSFWGPRFAATTTQGRHFFIALPAGAILFVLGLGAFIPRRWRDPAYGVFIGGMIFLDLYALVAVIRPAFS